MVLAFQLMFLFRIEVLSMLLRTIGLPSARWRARRALWVACASDRIYMDAAVKEQRFVAQIVMHFAGVCLLGLMGSGLLHQH